MDRESRNYDGEEIPGSSRSTRGYILTYTGRTYVSSGFSTERTLISASAVPHFVSELLFFVAVLFLTFCVS